MKQAELTQAVLIQEQISRETTSAHSAAHDRRVGAARKKAVGKPSECLREGIRSLKGQA
ncbi:hypothetical protein [Gimesia sp.]|uniref:hypothetical protein n=1 Tax=Gimesia sp. TaxID=2024833 RepID=UPI0032EB2676